MALTIEQYKTLAETKIKQYAKQADYAKVTADQAEAAAASIKGVGAMTHSRIRLSAQHKRKAQNLAEAKALFEQVYARWVADGKPVNLLPTAEAKTMLEVEK